MIRCSLRPPRFAFQAFWANDLYFACIVLILPAQRLTWLVKLELGFCLVSMYAHLKLTCLVSTIDRLWAIVNIFWGLRQPSIEMAKLLNLIYLSISPSKPQSSVPKVIIFHLFHLMISILNSMIVAWDACTWLREPEKWMSLEIFWWWPRVTTAISGFYFTRTATTK